MPCLFFLFFFLNSRSKAPEMKRGSEKGKGKIPTEKSKKGGNNLGNGWLSCWWCWAWAGERHRGEWDRVNGMGIPRTLVDLCNDQRWQVNEGRFWWYEAAGLQIIISYQTTVNRRSRADERWERAETLGELIWWRTAESGEDQPIWMPGLSGSNFLPCWLNRTDHIL